MAAPSGKKLPEISWGHAPLEVREKIIDRKIDQLDKEIAEEEKIKTSQHDHTINQSQGAKRPPVTTSPLPS